MKQKRVNRLALAAMLAALSVVFLYLTSVLPTGGLALSALAGILASVTCLECGFFWAAAHYAVCCALALLLAPEKTYVLWYVFALGLYGILKLPIEGVKQKALQWILKLAVLARAWRCSSLSTGRPLQRRCPSGAARCCIWFWPPCSSSMISV